MPPLHLAFLLLTLLPSSAFGEASVPDGTHAFTRTANGIEVFRLTGSRRTAHREATYGDPGSHLEPMFLMPYSRRIVGFEWPSARLWIIAPRMRTSLSNIVAVGRYSDREILLADGAGGVFVFDEMMNRFREVHRVLPPDGPICFVARVARDLILVVSGDGRRAVILHEGSGTSPGVVSSRHDFRAAIPSALIRHPHNLVIEWTRSLASPDGIWLSGREDNQGGERFHLYYDFSTRNAGPLQPGLAFLRHGFVALDSPSRGHVLARYGDDYTQSTAANGLIGSIPVYFSVMGRAIHFGAAYAQGVVIGLDVPQSNQPWLAPTTAGGAAAIAALNAPRPPTQPMIVLGDIHDHTPSPAPAPPPTMRDYLLRYWTAFASAPGRPLPAGTTAAVLPASLPARTVEAWFMQTFLSYELQDTAPDRWADLGLERSRPNVLRALDNRNVSMDDILALMPDKCLAAVTP